MQIWNGTSLTSVYKEEVGKIEELIPTEILMFQKSIPISIQCRPAEANDVNGIFDLNYLWFQAGENGDKTKGYLGVLFERDQIREMIEAREVAVAEIDGKVVAYYLVNSLFEVTNLEERKQLVGKLIRAGKLTEARYVYMAQAAVDVSFTGKGIGKNLFKTLKLLVNDRFDYIIGEIREDNNYGKEVNLKSGWSIIDETHRGYLVVSAVNED